MCGKFTSVDHIFAVCPSFSCHSSQTITEYPKYFVLKKLFLLLHRQIYKKTIISVIFLLSLHLTYKNSW